MYSRLFDEDNKNWSKDPEINRIFLLVQENYFNHLLKDRGHVFLNEVYDALGFLRSVDGQLVGWAYTTNWSGEIDEIRFGKKEAKKGNILLDFNVQGVILHRLVVN